MGKKYQDKNYVLRELSMTEIQLDRAIRTLKRRHPLELSWVVNRTNANNQKVSYYCTEFIDWLKSVYLNDEYYLDSEIKFYKNLITKLNDGLEVSIKYDDLSVQGMCEYFNKDIDSIRLAMCKMNKNFKDDLKYYNNDVLMVKAEGVKWINEHYYRKSYLKYLEDQKQMLDDRDL